jgi:intron-binding protein aquarius
MTQIHYKKITSLQKAAFAKFPDLRNFALSNVANVDTRESLERHFGGLDAASLKEIACYLNLVPEELSPPFNWHRLDEEFLKNLLVRRETFSETKFNLIEPELPPHRFLDTSVAFRNWMP